MMILVVGSTGLLGSEICHILARKGIPMRSLVRVASDPVKVEQLKKFGSAIVLGDLRDPASLRAACQGADAVICTASAFNRYLDGVNDFQRVDLEGVTNLVDSAILAGVARFIYISFSSSMNLHSPLLDAKRSVETYLRDSTLIYTILRSSLFMETWFSPAAGFDPIQATAVIYGQGCHPIRWISSKNVAQAAVNAIYNPHAFNGTFSLSGPEALSPNQAIALFETIGQRKFSVTYHSVNALTASRHTTGDSLAQSWASLWLGYAQGERGPLLSCPASIEPQLISLKEYVVSVYAAENKVNEPHPAYAV